MTDPTPPLAPDTILAWDFDGVLNRNIIDGRFVWADGFEADTGQSLDHFTATIFGKAFDEVITGRTDLRERVAAWAADVGYVPGADALLSYWFERDALPDARIGDAMRELSARGVRQIITTNNEPRRARFIETEMGFGTRVERLFASGHMGVRKPDAAFFEQVTDTLGVAPERMFLVDDAACNITAATACGWRAFHFTDQTRTRLGDVLGVTVSTA